MAGIDVVHNEILHDAASMQSVRISLNAEMSIFKPRIHIFFSKTLKIK